LIKPDAVKRGLAGQILARLEGRGLLIRGVRSFVFTSELIHQNYAHLEGRSFFPELCSYLESGMTIAVWVSGAEAVQLLRRMIGDTNARTAAPGTIRGDFSVSTQRNLIHASDSLAAAEVELARFFPDGPTVPEDTTAVSTLYSSTETA
jgi:nucleoside-diphosphate kinase